MVDLSSRIVGMLFLMVLAFIGRKYWKAYRKEYED